MRVLEEFTHLGIKASIFNMNQKYILKLERGPYEMTYKISEIDYIIQSLEQVKEIAIKDLIPASVPLFETMRSNFNEALKDY